MKFGISFVMAWQCALCVFGAPTPQSVHQRATLHGSNATGIAKSHNHNLFKNGFRVNINILPKLIAVPGNVSWNSFVNVTKLTTSAAYNIFTAIWNGQKVVIKSLRESKMRSGSPVEMEREINLLSRMDHPNIIKLLGAGFLPYRFQILEYLGGGTLHKVMKNQLVYTGEGKKRKSKPVLLQQQTMFDYGIKIAGALHYIHENFHPAIRLFHRDLKMQNIGISSSGEIKVFDFGMAEMIRKTVDENHIFKLGVAPEGGKALGTWPYTSPEVLRREKYNHKSDVYSFAIILYYIMVGKHPMRGYGDHVDLKKEVGIYNGWRPSPEPRWPDDLVQLYAEIWNNDIMVRPNMGEVERRLREINKKYPDIFTKPPPPKRKRGQYIFLDEVGMGSNHTTL